MPYNLDLKIDSEIGNLEAVILHKPGTEMERLTPDTLQESLFEDIPWVRQMQIEHDGFSQILQSRGAKVFYFKDLLNDILSIKDIKNLLLQQVISDANLYNESLEEVILNYLLKLDNHTLIEALISGVAKDEISKKERRMTLTDYVKSDKKFFLNPIPNLYFIRDPASVIRNTVSVNTMFSKVRQRESIIFQYIYDYHPLFQNAPAIHNQDSIASIEGGDILVLNKKTLLIGCSTRTTAPAIEIFAEKAFETITSLEEILVIEIPKLRSFMHLDTVLTMVDYDKFTVYPGIEPLIRLYSIRKAAKHLEYKPSNDSLTKAFSKCLSMPVQLIRSGGGNPITAAREQWNDSTNTLAIAPGVVVTYSRNEASNAVLRKHGIEVIEIADSELIRGRGGPRCMSMPLRRSDIE